jgi:drug/metabolite transporter (DMT)-like permease
VNRLLRGYATLLYESRATRDGRARVKTTSVSLQKRWRPKAGWGVPVAWLTLCVVWSSTWLAIKIGLRDLPPISFVAIRFLIAIIVLVAVSMGRTHLLPRRRNDYIVLAVTGVLMFAVNYTLLFWAELHVSSGLAAVLQASIPIFGMMFAHWMLPDEPLRLPKLAGAIIALGGVIVICARLLGFNGPLAFWGGVAVVVGAASAAFANVHVKARSMQLAPAMLAAWQMIFGTAPLLLLGFAVDGNPARFHWTPSALFCLLYLAVIGSALTFLLLYWLLPRLTVAQLQSISLITPPGAVMLGWLLGGETFPLSSLLGAALVLVGVWMIFRKAPVPDPLIQEG